MIVFEVEPSAWRCSAQVSVAFTPPVSNSQLACSMARARRANIPQRKEDCVANARVVVEDFLIIFKSSISPERGQGVEERMSEAGEIDDLKIFNYDPCLASPVQGS